jgi:hypothetical protein
MAPLVLLLLCACTPAPRDSDPPDSEPDTGPWPPPDPSTYRTALPAGLDLAGLVDAGQGVKFTAPIEGREREAPIVQDGYFQDMVAWPWHLPFLQAFPELRDLDMPTYEAWVIANDTRRWWGGELRFLPATPHPAGGLGILSFTFYADDSAGGTTVAHVREVRDRMATCAPWAADLLVWLPDGSPQQGFAEAEAEALAAAGLAWLPMTSLLESQPAEVLGAGEAEAVLRLDEAADGEILVAAVAPEPLPAVAALVVTEATPGLDALGVPVAVLDARGNAAIQALAGARVRVEVGDGRLALYPVHPESP